MLDCLCELINSGAVVNFQNFDGDTALMFAAMEGHVHCLKELIVAGAEVDIQGKYGRTALMSVENDQCMIELVNVGADVNTRDHEEYTRYFDACSIQRKYRSCEDINF